MPWSYCTIPNCRNPQSSRSLCPKHYTQWQRGKLLPIEVRSAHDKTPEQRFWVKVNKNGPLWNNTPCWLWLASCGTHGYGQFKTKDRQSMHAAHRWAYQNIIGPIPLGTELDHLCQNRPCVNPLHLEPVSHAENTRRAHRQRTTCQRGHPLDGFRSAGKNRAGSRYCKTCNAEQQRRRRVLRIEPTR